MDQLPYIKSHRNWIKRANAFRHIIFPHAKRRIKLQIMSGRRDLAQQSLYDVIFVIKPFIRKVHKAEHAKAFYIIKRDFITFLFDIGFDLSTYRGEDKTLNLLLR